MHLHIVLDYIIQKKKWIKNILITDGNRYSISAYKTTDSEYIRVSAPVGIYDTIQIEYGSEATSYEPYTEQSVQLPYTLNAIPVTSGGNVTIDGQQYITDYVDVERGKLVRMTDTLYIKNLALTAWKLESVKDFRVLLDSSKYIFPAYNANKSEAMSNIFITLPLYTGSNLESVYSTDKSFALRAQGGHALEIRYDKYAENVNDFKKAFADDYFMLALATPIEIDLTTEQMQALKELATYYPTTNISVNSEQLDGYTVFNYPISMANGWNYVKKQLNDNRDYIYDMDIQSAEAYVNSEYAVVLTELEV